MKRVLLVLAALALAGCLGSGPSLSTAGSPADNCIQMCEGARTTTLVGQDLSSGPCLGTVNSGEYACDIAHDPRTPEDDERENQCDSWHDGSAQGFVEVTPGCVLITEYHK